MSGRRRKHWGWGYEDEQPSAEELAALAPTIAAHLGFGSPRPLPFVALADLHLPEPRIAAPARLSALCSDDVHARASHAYGKSYGDVVRGFSGSYPSPLDFVVRPRSEHDIEAVLEWATGAAVAVIPYGGGTSVVGGVEPVVGGRLRRRCLPRPRRPGPRARGG